MSEEIPETGEAAVAKAGTTPKDMTPARQFTVDADDEGARLDRWFKRHLPEIPFAMVSRWARTGQLRLDGKRADPADRLTAGQQIRVPPAAPPSDRTSPRAKKPLTPEQEEFAQGLVIHRDRAAIIIDKPPGLATQGGTGTHSHVDGLLDALTFGEAHRPRLVHRLDKDTSGALLLARSPGAAAFFSRHFAGRSAKKTYWALVIGKPEIKDGMIELPIAKQPGSGGEKMHVDEENGQPAKSRYRVLESASDKVSFVELSPLTGRTHQLRVHMAAIGHPIVGDGKYGGIGAMLTGSISRKLHLHARRIRIDHPDGGKLDVSAEPPEHFLASLDQLGFDIAKGAPLSDEGPAPASREVKKQRARQHAKELRRGRRGERRGRGEGATSGAKPATAKGKPVAAKGKPAAKAPAGKAPATKPPSGKAAAKPRPDKARSDRPRSEKPGTDRPRGDKPPRDKPTR